MTEVNNYLKDVLNQLLEDAIDIKKHASSEFDQGKLIGYYEIISKLLNQADAFGISDSLPKNVVEFDLESLLENT